MPTSNQVLADVKTLLGRIKGVDESEIGAGDKLRDDWQMTKPEIVRFGTRLRSYVNAFNGRRGFPTSFLDKKNRTVGDVANEVLLRIQE